MPLPRLFDDPGRCADVVPGVLRAWVPARLMVGQDQGPELMVGMATTFVPSSSASATRSRCPCRATCGGESVTPISASAFWAGVGRAVTPLGCAGGAGSMRTPPPALPVVWPPWSRWCSLGRVRRRGEFCWGQQQTLHGVWLQGWCGRPEQPGITAHDQPAAAVGGSDWVDGEGNSEAVSLCRSCCEDWRYGTVFDPNWVGASTYR